jgi:hypothetical protein
MTAMTATFDGATIEKGDEPRLWSQLLAIADLMSDKQWRTLRGIKAEVNNQYSLMASEASISARLRDLRKPRFGAFLVERKRIGPGALCAYRVLPPPPTEQLEMRYE